MNSIKGKYWAEPVPGSVYGNVIGILKDQNIKNGDVIDFGCGYAPLAEPLQKMGFSYFGLDYDLLAIEDLNKRGFKGYQIDLREEINENYFSSTSCDKIKIALLLDVLEHFEPESTKLSEIVDSQDFDYLIISVPNVANRKVLSEIALNEFRYQETGIFDKTHLSFYTRNTLDELIRKSALLKIIENNTYEFYKLVNSNTGIKGIIKFNILKIINRLYRLINSDSEILQFVWLLKKQKGD